MSEVRKLEPQIVWNHFEDLNAVPRPSKKEERVIAFMENFGKSLGLETYTDSAGNVIIKKPATPGMEGSPTVILQSHLDMVHQKNATTQFDFDQDGIQSYIDGDWVTAKGTTLGADNGMGVAATMAVLSSTDIKHPAIEALFTIDEETGMTGAFELEQGILKGSIMLNLDTEDDDEFSIGCAGGIDTNTSYKYDEEKSLRNSTAYKLSITGLKGGHSGMDIHLERGNANKIMNRLIRNCSSYGLQIAEIDGGSLRNAIPRESFAIVTVKDASYKEEALERFKKVKSELEISDPNVHFDISECEMPNCVMSITDTQLVCSTLSAVYNGVYRMSLTIDGLVETSSSLAKVNVKDGIFTTKSLQRSSVESSKLDLAATIAAPFHLMGCEVEHTGSYPGWEPNPSSEVLGVMEKLYTSMFNESPKIKACHAGLECGILNERYPGLDIASFGPTIRNPHSPDEKVKIDSVQKFWSFLTALLEKI